VAREVIIRCDNCKANGLNNSAEPHVVSVDNMKARVVDLCQDCNINLLGAVRELLITYGVDLDKVQPTSVGVSVPAPRSTGAKVYRPSVKKYDSDPVRVEKLERLGFPVTCLYCPASLNSPSHSVQHMILKHDFANAGEVWGTTCPLCDKESPRVAMHVTTSHFMDMTEAVRQGATRPEPENEVAQKLLNQRRRTQTVPS
jgi:hypothetical protein